MTILNHVYTFIFTYDSKISFSIKEKNPTLLANRFIVQMKKLKTKNVKCFAQCDTAYNGKAVERMQVSWIFGPRILTLESYFVIQRAVK